MSVRAVLFDFGGVLYSIPDEASIDRWLRLFGLRDRGVLSMMKASPRESQLVMDIMTGGLPEQEAWNQLALAWKIPPPVLHFLRRRGMSPRRLNKDLLAYLDNLRPRYRTAILTNAGTDFRRTFNRAYRLERYADQLIISAEEGMAKPDPAIFQLACERLEVAADEAVFVDDLEENVESARETGLHAFVHESTQQTIDQLQKILSNKEKE